MRSYKTYVENRDEQLRDVHTVLMRMRYSHPDIKIDEMDTQELIDHLEKNNFIPPNVSSALFVARLKNVARSQ